MIKSKNVLLLITFIFFLSTNFSATKVFAKVTGAIFDLDGTIIDSMSMWEYVEEKYLLEVGISQNLNLSKEIKMLGIEEAAKKFKVLYNLKESEKNIVSRFESLIMLYYTNAVELKKGAKEFINDMQKDGIPIIVATSSSRFIAELVLSKFNMLDSFVGILSCQDFKTDKSKPDIFFEAIKILHSLPANTLVFEDSFYSAFTAFNYGFKVIGIYDKSNTEKQEDLKKLSMFYFLEYPNFCEFKKLALL